MYKTHPADPECTASGLSILEIQSTAFRYRWESFHVASLLSTCTTSLPLFLQLHSFYQPARLNTEHMYSDRWEYLPDTSYPGNNLVATTSCDRQLMSKVGAPRCLTSFKDLNFKDFLSPKQEERIF